LFDTEELIKISAERKYKESNLVEAKNKLSKIRNQVYLQKKKKLKQGRNFESKFISGLFLQTQNKNKPNTLDAEIHLKNKLQCRFPKKMIRNECAKKCVEL
jgi:hypothetical protein